MSYPQKIEVPIKKSILFVFLLIILTLIASASYFLYNTEKLALGKTFQGIAIGVDISFGLLGLICISKLIDFRPALTITNEGILNNTDLLINSEIMIKWEDITEIKIIEGFITKTIALIIKKPQDYINQQTSSRLKRAMTASYSIYGTPASISTILIKYNLNELIGILNKRLNENKSNLESLNLHNNQ